MVVAQIERALLRQGQTDGIGFTQDILDLADLAGADGVYGITLDEMVDTIVE